MQRDHRGQIQWRIILAWIGFNLLIGGLLYWNTIVVQGNILKQAEAAYMREQLGDMESVVQEIKDECGLLAARMAFDQDVSKAFLAADHDRLNQLILPIYAQWQDQYRVNQLQFISSRGLGVWDINKPIGSSGEDLNYRRIIKQSLEQKQCFTVIESIEGSNAIVSTVPLFKGDQFAGLCNLGVSLDKSLGDRLKRRFAGNYAIYELGGIESRLLWHQKASRTALNTDDIKMMREGKSFYRPSRDKKVMLAVVPLIDMDDIPVAYVQGEISRRDFIEVRHQNYLFAGLMMACALLTSTYIANRSGKRFISGENKLVRLTDQGKITQFGLNAAAQTKGACDDEQ